MEFRALGHLAALRDDDLVDLGSPKQRALLALLLIHANRPVSSDRILDELWGDDAFGKENSLHVHVSRLRAVLDPNRTRGESSVIETVGTGYQLTVDLDRFDVARFDRESDRGRSLLGTDPAAAAEALRSALSLWNGPDYDDFAYEDFVQIERTRLDEAHPAAIEDRIEAETSGSRGSTISPQRMGAGRTSQVRAVGPSIVCRLTRANSG